MVRSRIANLTPGPSFSHNLCFRCPNGSCETVLDIYVLRPFQWYKTIVNPMFLTPAIAPWRFGSPSELQLPKLGVHLGVWRFNSHTLPYSQPPGSMKCDSRTSLLDHSFTSPCVGNEPKARVATTLMYSWSFFLMISLVFYLSTHLEKLNKCFFKCRKFGISLNPDKCAFMVFLRTILSFIMSKEGKVMDPKKVEALVNMPIPTTP